ncbi:hypothetical protein AbraCBS73388_011147 [Aspergillus brasiliensis]|uniref:Uncharacterized protein n=1 Tax=Aspergillus brasiliensis TaxID=319629 RepID=A0A9W5YX73_9EURO|nr:hypothetical protein AbraCBS73388_011147 [Aspergillus brasiliensis]
MTTRPLSPPTSPRKRTKAMHLPSSQRICHDWMVVQGNVHYARDRAHFTTYRPVTAHLKNNIFNPTDELEVAGIGTVEIPVVRSLDNPFDTHTIVLENVLHIPEAYVVYGNGVDGGGSRGEVDVGGDAVSRGVKVSFGWGVGGGE